MLSDEEKKAMNELWHFDCCYNKEIKIVLNLIEKQSKEIEKLNDTTKIVFNEILKEIKEGDKNCKYAEKENWKQEEIWEKN